MLPVICREDFGLSRLKSNYLKITTAPLNPQYDMEKSWNLAVRYAAWPDWRMR